MIILLLATAALYTLPLNPWPRHIAYWRVPAASSPLALGTNIPVFCVASRGGTSRCGVARVVAERRLQFIPYGGLQVAAGVTPLLASADFSVLWALADPQGRFKVRDDTAALAEELAGRVHDLTQSAVWQREYRPPLSRLLRRVAEQVWLAPETQHAFGSLLDAVQPAIRQSLEDDLGPALAPYITDATWQILTANSGQLMSLISGSPLDLAPLGPALDNALRDPATRQALGRLGPRIMALPQAEVLTEHLANSLATVLKREPAMLDVITRIATDPRLDSPLGHVRDQADAVLRECAELLWGLGGSNSLNSLAGLVMRAMLADSTEPLILLVGHREEQLLRYELPNEAIALAQDHPP